MKTLFDPARVREVTGRLAQLTPAATRQWGKMDVARMLAHCAVGIETAMGEHRPPRVALGRILGRVIKPLALRDDAPMKKNSPTAPIFVINAECDFQVEKARLHGLLERFAAAGAEGCTSHPHSFFGRLSPDEWATLMYKHVDHHLRQFGA